MAKTVLVTGSSSGIGRLTAALFAGRSWNVAATARDPAAVAGLAGASVAAFRLDVTNEATIADAVASAVSRFGGIDVLVNNAGCGIYGPLEAIGREQLEEIFRVNVLGMAAVIGHVLPAMRRQRSGTIVNVSSLGGRITSPFMSAYYATKFAVEGLSESLRYELAPHGIRVKLVEPNHFKTAFVNRGMRHATHEAYEPHAGNMWAWVLERDRRAPTAEPVAEMIYAAATDPSSRLRYPVRGGVALALHAIVPDAVWRSMMTAGMMRKPPLPG
jgi:NAD(P)-dependent dehydrogenase (short-subunit alcohol dehydrogenase family)